MNDMVPGKVYGNWRVLSTFKDKQQLYCSVQCVCGETAAVSAYNLRSGRSTQCRKCGFANRKRLYPIDMVDFIESRARDVYRKTKRQAEEERGLEFDLSYDRFKCLILSPCYYCDEPWSNTVKGSKHRPDFHYNGIDRTDNGVGYTLGNSVPCCWKCNRAKSAMGYAEWSDWISRLAGNFQRWGV